MDGIFQGLTNGTCYLPDVSVPGGSCADVSLLDLSGLGAGVHAGFNWQTPNGFGPGWDSVYGIEAGATFMNLNDEVLAWYSSDGGVVGVVDMLASVRARVGVAFDKTHIYATAGAALGSVSGMTYETYRPADEYSFTAVGGVVGAGVEQAISDNVSFRAEALYYVFNNEYDIFDAGHYSANSGDYIKLDNALAIRMGVNFRF